MSNLSRVQKNQSLIRDVENDREEALISPALSSYAQRLKKINPVFSNVEMSESNPNYLPLHTNRENAYQKELKPTQNSFVDNSVMDEFLEEVKAYNLEKGYRNHEDTSKDILNLKQAVAPVVQNESFDLDPINQEIRRLIEDDFEESDKETTLPMFEDKSLDETTTELHTVIEETQKLKVQLSEYEKGLVDMNESVLSSNRVLNIVVFVLVLVLMIMLGIAIYWVLYSKGFY